MITFQVLIVIQKRHFACFVRYNSFLQKVLNASTDNLMRSLRDNPQQKYPIQLHFAALNPKTLFEY